eukprot:gnl/Spiro4/21198_TR10348_c0_g1_i1.p1 gnl/Spiro4/21198_TR10348_c0_g1~~gnl/Spiro4/21198_TR10348_c0_g1_i1.p1  ORF type:complete len:167 (+),score=43.26 gnl/Spiro4/21198_TR10348_c0_g1_i1:101-601(+)
MGCGSVVTRPRGSAPAARANKSYDPEDWKLRKLANGCGAGCSFLESGRTYVYGRFSRCYTCQDDLTKVVHLDARKIAICDWCVANHHIGHHVEATETHGFCDCGESGFCKTVVALAETRDACRHDWRVRKTRTMRCRKHNVHSRCHLCGLKRSQACNNFLVDAPRA